MTLTRSEQPFEEFCNRHCLRWNRHAVSNSRTPDYDVYFYRRKVIVEVKEITPNREEVEAHRLAKLGQFAVVDCTPGQRVRGKIGDAVPQLRAATRGRFPGLLVLMDTGFATDHTSPYNIRVAMHGFETHVLGVPSDPNRPVYLKDKVFGRGKKTTPHANTSLSAIAVLNSRDTGLSMIVYHNPYARVPMPIAALKRLGATQYELAPKTPGTLPDWQEI